MILIPQYRTSRRAAFVAPINLIFEGDSITASVAPKSFGYIYAGSANLAVANSLIEGAAPSLTNRAATLDALIDSARANVLVVMTGNDMIADTAANMLTKMATYLDNRRAAGWYVIIWTVLPRTTGGFNTKRNTANTTLRTWVGTHCDAIVDFDVTSMGPDAAASDTGLYGDGIHPTLAGHRLLLAQLQATLNALPYPSTAAPTAGLIEHWKLNTGLTQAAGVASAWKGVRRGFVLSASGTAQPAVQGDGSLLFDGSTDYMESTFAWAPDGFTLFMLAKQVTWASTDCIFDGALRYTGTLFQYTTTPGLQGYNGTTFTSQNNDLAVSTFAAIALTISLDGCLIQIDANTATTSTGLAPANMGGITLGAAGDNNQRSNIQVKELLLYRGALDSTARAAVRSYLAGVP